MINIEYLRGRHQTRQTAAKTIEALGGKVFLEPPVSKQGGGGGVDYCKLPNGTVIIDPMQIFTDIQWLIDMAKEQKIEWEMYSGVHYAVTCRIRRYNILTASELATAALAAALIRAREKTS